MVEWYQLFLVWRTEGEMGFHFFLVGNRVLELHCVVTYPASLYVHGGKVPSVCEVSGEMYCV